MGLSPRVRGHRLVLSRPKASYGSIPACAGAPSKLTATPVSTSVYPRVCGGTWQRFPPGRDTRGLSPRVRGHHSLIGRMAYENRSIPACAGAPRTRQTPRRTRRVYPRVCGGTTLAVIENPADKGLSPRVRGHRFSNSSKTCGIRSIPACAGAPPWSAAGRTTITVYPRVCGGTLATNLSTTRTTGLSPRVRGHPLEILALSQICERGGLVVLNHVHAIGVDDFLRRFTKYLYPLFAHR